MDELHPTTTKNKIMVENIWWNFQGKTSDNKKSTHWQWKQKHNANDLNILTLRTAMLNDSWKSQNIDKAKELYKKQNKVWWLDAK